MKAELTPEESLREKITNSILKERALAGMTTLPVVKKETLKKMPNTMTEFQKNQKLSLQSRKIMLIAERFRRASERSPIYTC